MTDGIHLPECLALVEENGLCICEQLHLCARRVRDNERLVCRRYSTMRYERGKSEGYDEALNAAWQKIAAVPDLVPRVMFRDTILSTIDDLRVMKR